MVSNQGNQHGKRLGGELTGVWEVVGLLGEVPLFGLMKATGSVIILARDGSCEARLKLRLGGVVPVPALPRHLQGTYFCPTENTIRFEGTWKGRKESLTYRFSLVENTLKLKSIMGYSLVLHRRSSGET